VVRICAFAVQEIKRTERAIRRLLAGNSMPLRTSNIQAFKRRLDELAGKLHGKRRPDLSMSPALT
jgi:hypothetical protein